MSDVISKYARVAMCWLRERRRWKDRGSRDSVRVYYGFEDLPGSNDVTGGGMVKVQDLVKHYPNTPRGANTLYFVSSSLPENPRLIVDSALKTGVRLIWNQNGVGYSAWDPVGWSNTNVTLRRLLRRASFVIYQSQFCKRAADKFLGECLCDWAVLHNPVDTTLFVPAKHTTVNAGPVLLLGGTHTDWYRLEVALHVVHNLRTILPGVRFIIAGRHVWVADDKEARARIMRFARQIGIADVVEVRGGYAQVDAPRLMQSSDILLHTKEMDACPRVVVEAMACGVPVVCPESGGLSELVGTTAGITVPAEESWERVVPADAEALADSVCRIWQNYLSFSKAARKRAVEQFDVRPWLKRHAEIFEHVLRM